MRRAHIWIMDNLDRIKESRFTYDELRNEMEDGGCCIIINRRSTKGLYNAEEQEESMDGLYTKYALGREEPYDHENSNLEHVFDDMNSGIANAHDMFDAMKSMEFHPMLVHVCNHDPMKGE